MADGRFALIVANSSYADATLSQLEAPELDADSLATVLAKPEIGGFDVKTLLDARAADATQQIEAFFDQRQRNDLLLFYFTGHGILDQNARLYFATPDTQVDRPRSTSIAASLVNELMSECRSRRQVLMLDCCNSGSFGRGAKAGGMIGMRERFEGRGRVVITASDALQYAFEENGQLLQMQGGVRSVFTHFLVDGLQSGNADLNGDGYVTLDELYDYVYERVVETSPRQRPGKWAFGVEGQIVIAHSGTPAAAAPVAEPDVRRARPSGGRSRPSKRTKIAAVAALLVIAVAGAAAFALHGSSPSSASSASLTAERQLMLAAYRNWQHDTLAGAPASTISAAAKTALAAMPTGPVSPTPPKPDDCYGDAGNATCVFAYPGLGIELHFNVLRYGNGLRLAAVECLSSDTSVTIPIATCARRVSHN